MPLAPTDSEVWFLTGSQSLYGEDTLAQVAAQSQQICETIGADAGPAARIVWKPVLTEADAIRRVCLDAEADDRCIGLIAWMHTFSPPRCGSAASVPCGSRSFTSTPRRIADSPGPRSTWIS